MWSAGVSLVTWFTLRDQPLATSPYQSGLYFLGSTFARDRPKPALTAFRFPFVAYPAGKRISVWGRTPTSRAGAVVVEQRDASSWDVVATAARRPGRDLLGPGPPEGERPVAGAVPGCEGDVAPVLARRARPTTPTSRSGRPCPRRPAACASNAAVSQYVETEPSAAAGRLPGQHSAPGRRCCCSSRRWPRSCSCSPLPRSGDDSRGRFSRAIDRAGFGSRRGDGGGRRGRDVRRRL